MRVSSVIIGSVLAMAWAACFQIAAAAPKAELWERWSVYTADSTTTIDHSAWQSFLTSNVRDSEDGVNRIAYGEVSAADRALLDSYIQTLSAQRIDNFRRDEQLAYWINFYNALTVKVVLDNYPVTSILKISSGLFSIGPWSKKRVDVEGEALSLDDIEHRILRPIWQDPRIHYAVNCASIGCPNLRKEAFTPANLDTALTVAAREFINSERGMRIDNGRLYVSSIFAWFADDFGSSDEAVIAHLRQYSNADRASQLAEFSRISDDFYDWDLNEPR